MDVYQKLKELNITLPPPPPKGGIYKPVRPQGNLLYISGQGCTVDGVPAYTGALGTERTVEEGQEAAKLCAINALSVLQDYLGDLNKIKGLVKTLGFVKSGPGFSSQPTVINGASGFLMEVFGEAGVGARSAIGVSELPGNISVEIEFIFEI